MAKDVARAIGGYGEKIENRSLLLEKFPCPKSYGHFQKSDAASRRSILRISDGGREILHDESSKARHNAKRKNDDRLHKEANLIDALARTSCEKPELLALRAKQAQSIREKTLLSYGDKGVSMVAKLEGRMAINLAEGLIENAGICLDRLFGLPYIPGSAVKGIARHAALWNIRNSTSEKKEEALLTFAKTFGFGTVEARHPKSDLAWALDEKQDKERFDKFLERLISETKAKDNSLQGGISFFPAYPISPDAKIVVDLTNVHYPNYYRYQNLRDLKKENPRPNPFPVVEKGTSFSFLAVINGTGAQHPDSSALLSFAKESLAHALTKNGVGAKTGAGYGWFSIEKEAPEAN